MPRCVKCGGLDGAQTLMAGGWEHDEIEACLLHTQAVNEQLCAAIRDFIDARAALMNASEQGREWADEKNAYNAAEDAIFAAYDFAMSTASSTAKNQTPDRRTDG